MDWRLAFTEFLLAFCGVVLADRVYGFSERLLAAGGGRRETEKTARSVSDLPQDWYVCFPRSELTGGYGRPVATTSGQTDPDAPRPTARRRDDRPRLRA